MVPSRGINVLVRVLLGITGIAGLILVFVIHGSTADWSAPLRVLATIPGAALFSYGLAAVSELRDKPDDRDLLRFRRFGRRRVSLSVTGDLSATEIQLPTVHSEASRRRFSTRPTGSLIALTIGATGCLITWNTAVSAMGSSDLSESGLLSLWLLPVALWLTGRSLYRLALSPWGVTVDDEAITLGSSLGFAWPVRVKFAEARLISILSTGKGPEFLIAAADDRTYLLSGRKLVDAQGLTDWLMGSIAGASTAPIHEPLGDNPPPLLSAPEAPSSGSRPNESRITAAHDMIRRRTWIVGSVLVAGLALTCVVAWLYMSLRAENSHLEASGNAYVAEVFDVNRYSRGPDDIHVRFEAEGKTYERIIWSGWFHGFNRGLRGTTIPVLFDPAEEGIAKLPGSNNFPSWLGIGGLLALVVVGISLELMRAIRSNQRALTTDQWERITLAIGDKQNAPLRVRRSQDRDDQKAGVIMRSGGRRAFHDRGAWMATNGRGVLVLPDDTDQVLLDKVGKRSPLRETS